MKCSCCGEDRDSKAMAALRCSDDVKVCRGCISWLRDEAGVIDATPTLPVIDMNQSVAFYEAGGFDVEVYASGGYAFVRHEDESIFDLGLEPDLDPATNRAACYLIVAVPDEWHARFTELHYPVSDLRDEAYGMREFALTDPSGNRLRFGHSN